MKRPPIVAVLGHIDHGKSTLLDYIRKTTVAENEAGGITQHVSAYEITHQGKRLTFIDTPGHEAFSGMRFQGAAVADIAILVVSAEDGVKPQTLEAKTVIEKNGLPYLVAISKIDKPAADLERTKKNLSENGIFLEGLGGQIPFVPISAKTGDGIPELLELLLLLAEMTELKQDRPSNKTSESGQAVGFVLEAKRNPQTGILATIIIRHGTLNRGDYLTAGTDCFRIRKLENFRGEDVTTLSASSPAIIFGWSDLPQAGVRWQSFDERHGAEACAEKPITKLARVVNQSVTAIPVIIKADTVGTLEAIEKEVTRLHTTQPELDFKLTASGVGAITENDIKLARNNSNAIIIGFNVKIDKIAKVLAEKHKLEPRSFKVIYQLNEWLTEELKRRTPKTKVETIIGTAKVVKIFGQQKNRQVVGCLVINGCLVGKRRIVIKRREAVLGDGQLLELKQLKNTVDQVEKGKQCGALIESRLVLAPNDSFDIVEITRT